MTAVLLGTATPGGEAITLADAARGQGIYVLGTNGMGKSTLLLQLLAHDLAQGIGCCLVDPHGDLTHEVLKRVTAENEARVFVLELAAEHPPGLNLFHCADRDDSASADRAADRVVQIFKKLFGSGSWGALIEDMLGNLAYTFLDNPAMTLVEVPRFLADQDFRRQLVGRVTNPVVREYWLDEYDSLSRSAQLALAGSTLRKVRRFLRNGLLYHTLGQSRTMLDFREAMDAGWCLLVRLPVGTLGEEVVALVGALVLELVLQAAYSRVDLAEGERRPFHLYCDEYHLFATPATAALFTGGRKFGVGTTVAHQVRSQLEEENRSTTLNAANLVFFQLTGKDSREVAGELTGQRGAAPLPREPLAHLKQHGHPNARVLGLALGLLGDAPRAALGDINQYLYLRLAAPATQGPLPLTRAARETLRGYLDYELAIGEAEEERQERRECHATYLARYYRLLPPERALVDRVRASWARGELRHRRLRLGLQLQRHNRAADPALRTLWPRVAALATLLAAEPPGWEAGAGYQLPPLPSLPPYHAYVKLRHEGAMVERLVAIAAPDEVPLTAERARRIERIAARSRARFGRPVAEVARAIAGRQAELARAGESPAARGVPPAAPRAGRRRVVVGEGEA